MDQMGNTGDAFSLLNTGGRHQRSGCYKQHLIEMLLADLI